MGWWGEGLLDGDEPNDIYYDVAVSYLGGRHFTEFDDEGKSFSPKHKCEFYIFPVIPQLKDFNKAWKKIIKRKDHDYYLIILSLIAMKFGIRIDREKRKQLEHCALEEMNKAQGHQGRERHLNLYIEAVKNYNHKVKWQLENDGTFTPLEPNSMRFIEDP